LNLDPNEVEAAAWLGKSELQKIFREEEGKI
jgi:hypothetical protein